MNALVLLAFSKLVLPAYKRLFLCSSEVDALLVLHLAASGPNEDVNQDSIPVPTLHRLVQYKLLRNSHKLFFLSFWFHAQRRSLVFNCAVLSSRPIINHQDTNFVRNMCQILFSDVFYDTSGHYYLFFSRS